MAIFLNIPVRRENENHREFTHRVIQQNIMDLTLPPNTILNEGELAAALNVSRTPVHEALKLLAKESLVEIVPSKETRVAKIDFQQIMDGLFTRICIEPAIIDRLMGQVSNDNIKLLQNNLRLQHTAIQTKDMHRYYWLDDEFHRFLYYFSNKTRTYNLLRRLLNQYARFRMLYYQNCDYWENAQESLNGHVQIFFAITVAKPLPDGPENFFRRHVARSILSFPELIKKYPDYFTGYDGQELHRAIHSYLNFD